MKEVEEMNDSEKSVLLAKLIGYQTNTEDSPIILTPNFYHTSNMELAWQVLNWWRQMKKEGLPEKQFFAGFGYFEAWMDLPAEQAQIRWLDKILKMAIDAELVEG